MDIPGPNVPGVITKTRLNDSNNWAMCSQRILWTIQVRSTDYLDH